MLPSIEDRFSAALHNTARSWRQALDRRLKDLGVVFRGEPANMGPVIAVAFEDTCGNLLHLVQRNM